MRAERVFADNKKVCNFIKTAEKTTPIKAAHGVHSKTMMRPMPL